ncbi:Txe/YoeB family addiction module toxin [Spirulina subsalsa]|uniref:Txe/YoeB family addiction module toxin n=1 Tax=Spirulina subsalsa TaxID=54311 RepID=UPI002238B6F0|nr:Txe/YoeB family addiction module toxin [Spirulina subsalsa]
MSPKKKKQTNKIPNNQISAYFPVFSPDFKADLAWWYRTEPKKGDKILDLVADILNGEPFTGLGKPEPLKYITADTWSRRIDLEHRLVYKVTGNKVYFLPARYHYESD